ncbi:MAG: DUF302 domain-containing protein [Gammaproteobacteria bacterium]
MKKIWTANCSVSEARDRLTDALLQRKFGVLHVHDLKATLNSKGVPFEPECQVLEVCNPQQAAKVLAEDIDLNMALPCRVSVYEKDGGTRIAMMSPKAMLEQLSDSPALREVAEEVETVLEQAIDQASR